MTASTFWLNLYSFDLNIQFTDLTAFLAATRLEDVLPQLKSSNPTSKVPEPFADHTVELLTPSVKEDVIRQLVMVFECIRQI